METRLSTTTWLADSKTEYRQIEIYFDHCDELHITQCSSGEQADLLWDGQLASSAVDWETISVKPEAIPALVERLQAAYDTWRTTPHEEF